MDGLILMATCFGMGLTIGAGISFAGAFSDSRKVEAPKPARDPNAPRFDGWSQVAEKLCYHFKVSAVFQTTACFNPKGSAAMMEVIRTMGQKLDIAVDNAWAGEPPAGLLKKAADLGASTAAQKEV